MRIGTELAGLTVVAWWLTQRFVDQRFKREFEEYRAKLEHEHALAMASLEGRYLRLNETRFTAVVGIYEKMLRMLWCLEEATDPGALLNKEFRSERLRMFGAEESSLNQDLNAKRVLLPRSLCDDLRSVALGMASVADRLQGAHNPDSMHREALGPYKEMLLGEITDRLRKEIGVYVS